MNIEERMQDLEKQVNEITETAARLRETFERGQKLQQIDMTPFIVNGLDCEFWNPGIEPVISCLQKIDPEELEPYRVTRDFTWFRFCIPRLNHPFLWSEDIELPEGLVVEYLIINDEDQEEWVSEQIASKYVHVTCARIVGCEKGYTFVGE